MVISRLSSKNQITIPQKVREAIKLQSGDAVFYEVKGDSISIRRVDPMDLAFYGGLSATMDEWMTPEDEAAFGDL